MIDPDLAETGDKIVATSPSSSMPSSTALRRCSERAVGTSPFAGMNPSRDTLATSRDGGQELVLLRR